MGVASVGGKLEMDLGKNGGLVIEGRIRYNVCKLCIPKPNQFRSSYSVSWNASVGGKLQFHLPVNRECRVNIGIGEYRRE